MRFLLINHIQNAHQSLRSSRVRSMLTMLGISIGIASITIILSLSFGANNMVNRQISSLGNNIAIIKPGKNTDLVTGMLQTQYNHGYSISPLTEADVEYVINTPHVKSVAPMMMLSQKIKTKSTSLSGIPIIATTPELANISNMELFEGQFITKDMNQNSIILGKQLSINLFGTESSTGRLLTIKDQEFTVNGILERINEPLNFNSIDFDNTAFMSLEAGKKLNGNSIQIQQINLKADSTSNLDGIVKALNQTITTSHDGEKDFYILTGKQVSQPLNQLLYLISTISTTIAAIALVVGGIGIMNIMLVTVSERTREIGIRKAIGASSTDIIWQFLIESLTISLGGWISGYIVGYILSFLISTLLSFNPVISWQILVLTLSVSIIVGTVFGLYPAIKAAHKDPIESLRQYD